MEGAVEEKKEEAAKVEEGTSAEVAPAAAAEVVEAPKA